MVMFVLLTAVAILIKVLSTLPGNIARCRGHPQDDAINVQIKGAEALKLFLLLRFNYFPTRLHRSRNARVYG